MRIGSPAVTVQPDPVTVSQPSDCFAVLFWLSPHLFSAMVPVNAEIADSGKRAKHSELRNEVNRQDSENLTILLANNQFLIERWLVNGKRAFLEAWCVKVSS
jgi:hypothetical protein